MKENNYPVRTQTGCMPNKNRQHELLHLICSLKTICKHQWNSDHLCLLYFQHDVHYTFKRSSTTNSNYSRM